MNLYEFYTGKEFEAYEFLGAHKNEDGSVTFRTFAPNAKGAEVIGEFNDWQGTAMNRAYDGSIFECIIHGATEGQMYKYRIHTADGGTFDHADPYGFGMETPPKNASIIRDLDKYKFRDSKWMKNRTNCMDKPVNIYEMHLGSWRRKLSDEEREANEERADCDRNYGECYSYSELAELLVPYLKESGYNYVEFLPLAEHPCDNSWGYQITGFFSPTARYGTAEELMELIDTLHRNDIGAILDFVPVHFAVDEYALANYDGSCLYEYPHTDVGFNEWGSKNFCHSRGEVRSFLQSSANYWLEKYHFDGLRMDAISNIIYWQGSKDRGVNGNAVDFIKVMNNGIKERHPNIMLFAEDSTAFPKVTAPVNYGGLGFDYKWDMGWMNDTLNYFRSDPYFRGGDAYNIITFSMMYFYQENFMLPFSHDEVVHGKATILQKMFGDYEIKFPQARTLYMYMYMHPGKKLNFMGNEIGQIREWDERREQDWDLRKYPVHDAFYRYIKELNHLYLENEALYKEEMSESGFEWLECQARDKCIYAIKRTGGDKQLAAIFNMGGAKEEYEIELKKEPKLLINSDWDCFGGEAAKTKKCYSYKNGKLKLVLNAFTGLIFQL